MRTTSLAAFSNATPTELLEANYGENLLIYVKTYTDEVFA